MKLLSAALCLFALCNTATPSKADSLSGILARMNKSAPAFQTLQADMAMDTYQKIIDSHTVENGTLQMQRSHKGDVRAIIDFTGNSPRKIAFLGKTAKIYYPAINQYQEVSLGSSAAVINQVLLLGFGSSGDELAQSYTITEEGQEKVSGLPTTRLLLVPKDSSVLERLSKAELWIPDDASNPIQQKFYEQTGNYRLIAYSNMKLNPPIAGTLELKLPKNAKKQR